MPTTTLTDAQLYAAAHTMEYTGGSFAAAIAQAFFHADKGNRERLLCAFGDLFERFAPQPLGESK